MAYFVYFALIFVISLLLQSYLDLLSIAGIKPDLLFLFTIYFSFKEGDFRGAWIGFIVGLVQDAISLTPLGWQALPKGIIGFLVGRHGRSIRGESLFSLGIMIFLLSLVKSAILIFFAYIFIEGQLAMVYKSAFPEAIYNAILGPMLFTIYDRIFALNIVGGSSV